MDGQTYHWLNREPLNIRTPNLTGERILVTGADGFIGTRLCTAAEELGASIYASDIRSADVLNAGALHARFTDAHPTIVIHLAAHKYATTAEVNPASVAELNITGTKNAATLAWLFKAKLILASTCKAADPCTVYGASKLIAERIVLNYETGIAFRLVNVIGSTGSVIDIWESTPENKPIKVTPGLRYWISPEEAVGFLLASTEFEHGLYAPNTQLLGLESTSTIAKRFNHPGATLGTPLRRGDRFEERVEAEYESIEEYMGPIMKIRQPWD